MRIHGVLLLIASALAGCRPAERNDAASGARGDTVIPASATVLPVAATDTGVRPVAASSTEDLVVMDSADTAPESREHPGQPNDCRYVGPRRQAVFAARFDSTVMENGVPFRCRLRPGGPEVRLVVSGRWSIPMAVQVFLPAGAGRPMQALALDNEESAYEGGDLVVGEDLNGDGWMDLRVGTYYGSGGRMFDVFRFDPAARRFVPDTALPGMNVHRLPGRPCVGTSWKTSAWDYTSADYCWSGGTWVMTRTFRQELLRGGGDLGNAPVIRTLSERRGGRMQLVRMDTVPQDAPDW